MNDKSNTRIEMLKAYLADDPSDPFLHYALALEYIPLSRNAEAIVVLEDLLKNSPDYLAAYYQLGKLYEKQLRNEEALKTYSNGIAIAKSQKDLHTLSELQGAIDLLD